MSEELIELLADLEHDRWSRWMKYMFANFTRANIMRWRRQMITPYGGLPEHSKESDRKEARKTMEIVGPRIKQLEADSAALQQENERLQSADNDGRQWIGDLKRQVAALREAVEYMNAIIMPDGNRQCPWCDATLDQSDNGHEGDCLRQKALEAGGE